MRRKEKLPELLAPAGSFECLLAAVAAGADAVYVGGKRFGARAYAKNFDTGELSRAVSYCHLNGVKLYVTLNTLLGDKEMADAVEYARELYLLGVDALIVADFGLVSELRLAVPNMELHASTQCSVHNTYGANALSSLGVSRVVLARELSLSDISSVCDECAPEIEVFLHGALCVSHSGQCLFSSLVGGRSGNRGECAQPCRLPYSFTSLGRSVSDTHKSVAPTSFTQSSTTRSSAACSSCATRSSCVSHSPEYSAACGRCEIGNGVRSEYPLSLRDLSLAMHVPELISSGVSSLKIEGRMKSPSYVYTVTSVYRRLLDEGRSANEDERELLRRAFSRDGFTDGYFTGKIRQKMTGVRSDLDKEISRLSGEGEYGLLRHPVCASVKIKLGEPAEMTLSDGTRCVSVKGAVARRAETSPLSPEGVKERLSKMGNTYLSLSVEDINLTLDEGANLSPGEINALRRCAAEKFEDFSRPDTLPGYKYEIKRKKCQSNFPTDEKYGILRREGKLTTAQFFSEKEYLDTAMSEGGALLGVDISFVPLFSSDMALALSKAVFLPPVILNSEMGVVRDALEKAKRCGVLYALVDNIGHLDLAKEYGFVIFAGFRLNITNGSADRVIAALGAEKRILSAELTLPQARDISGGVITYGRIPLMLTERCFAGENLGSDGCLDAALVDRRGERFPVIREFKHRNIILNSAVTYMADKRDELNKMALYHSHLLFTVERSPEIIKVLRAHKSAAPLPNGEKSRRVGRRTSSR